MSVFVMRPGQSSSGARAAAMVRRAAIAGPLALATAAALSLALVTLHGGRAHAEDGVVAEDANAQVRHITVTLNKSRTLRFQHPFASAVIGQPEMADVLPMTDSTLYVQGKKVGATNISVFDDRKQLIGVVDLEVAPDTASLRSKIEASTGGRNINVSSANGEVVLSGEASDALAASRAVAVAKGLSPEAPIVDAMKVAPSQQVMLKVRILEVDRNAGRDLGVNWQVFGSNKVTGYTGYGSFTNGTIGPNGQPGVGVSSTFAGAASAVTPFGAMLANVVNTHGVQIDTLLTALESKGLVKSLAEPNLIALSGDEASFLAGGEIPVPTVQPGSNGGVPTVTIDYKPYGVELKFTPTVLANGLINLKLAPSVSQIDTNNAVLVNGTTIPQLTKREAKTSIELRDGQSFAIAGLLQASVNEDISQLPGLGAIPILGALFRSTSFQKHETDLVIIVSPHLVKPVAPGQKLATPFDQNLQANDVDLFLMGDLERKKKYHDYVTSGGELKGPYGHILQ